MKKEEILIELEQIAQDLIPVVYGSITDSSWMRPKLISFKERVEFANHALRGLDELIKKLNIEENAQKEVCPVCGGHGELSKPPYDDSAICPECDGKGHTK